MPRVVDHATNLQLKYAGAQARRPSVSNLGGTSRLSSLIAPPAVNSAPALRSEITHFDGRGSNPTEVCLRFSFV